MRCARPLMPSRSGRKPAFSTRSFAARSPRRGDLRVGGHGAEFVRVCWAILSRGEGKLTRYRAVPVSARVGVNLR